MIHDRINAVAVVVVAAAAAAVVVEILLVKYVCASLVYIRCCCYRLCRWQDYFRRRWMQKTIDET